MSITKNRVKSAVSKHNDTSAFSPKCSERTKSFQILQRQKSKILSLSTKANASGVSGSGGGGEKAKFSNKIPPEAAIVAGTTTTTTATTTTTLTTAVAIPTTYSAGISNNPVTAANMTNSSLATTTTTSVSNALPQSNLLKIEPFVPSLATRIQKPFRRSYSTLSTTTLKKRLHNPNANLAVNLEISSSVKRATAVHESKLDATLAAVAINTGCCSAIINSPSATTVTTTATATALTLAKVTKPGHTTLRRRPAVRGTLNRQRSKSTSSSNSASNRPATSSVTSAAYNTATPTLQTPCSSPNNAVVIPQPNGICRIQRNAKEQEKLPDRINYDKRGLTAIPIFEKETNLRLLSLQHNLINTFHIPKELKMCDKPDEDEAVECLATRSTELHVTNSANLSYSPALSQINRPRFTGPTATPTTDYPASIVGLQNNTTVGSFGAYMLQRNKLLHRAINLNNVTLQQNGPAPQPTAPALRFAMRKSKSFINNFNLQYQISKRSLNNPRASYLKKASACGHLKSFDSSASNLTTTDSASTLTPTPDLDDTQQEAQDPHVHDGPLNELEIKNHQLLVNYGSIFQNLVFLDLYDNQIERVSSLDGLTALSVLLLGKNRITDISGLASLKSTLKVLDLHGNKICSIANKINCLRELKSLNLAGNQIRQINQMDFLGLSNLKELNLKRNKLKRINGFQHLSSLERLWLCHNDLHRVDDMSSIAQAANLVEVTIENNPVSLAGDCMSFLVSHLGKLQTLSQMPITEQVRKAAMTWRANKELSEQSCQLGNKEQFNLIRREEIISNARTNWELLRSQQMLQHATGSGTSTGTGTSTGNGNGNDTCTNTITATSGGSSRKLSKTCKLNGELEKITEANEQSYEEFIKLPPIEAKQDAYVKEKDERTSSASSLGPNVNSSSSCYSSGEDDELDKKIKHGNAKSSHTTGHSKRHPNELHTLTHNRNDNDNESDMTHSANGQQLTATKKHQHNDNSTNNAPLPISAPTLTIQFPLEGINGKSSNTAPNQNQTANQSTLINGSTSSSTAQAATTSPASASSASSPSPPASSLATTRNLSKRYMTGSLIRSQTIVGTGTGGAHGHAIKATATTTTTTAAAPTLQHTAGAASAGQQQSLRHQQGGKHFSSSNATAQTMGSGTATATTTASALSASSLTTHQQQTALETPLTPGTIAVTVSTSSQHNTSGQATVNPPMTNGFGGSLTSSLQYHTTKTSLGHHNGPMMASSGAAASATKLSAIEREREQGGDYLIEICGRYLNIYGQGALRFIDKQWNPTKASDVHTLNFSYINFNNITTILARIKVRFPHAENFVFRETNINSLGQLHALAELQGITSLLIDPEGNSLTCKNLWREYAIYRLSHWGLKTLNGIEVTPQDRDKANNIYAGLSELILWSMPDAMLQPLLTRLRLEESCSASKMLPKQWLQKPDNRSLRLVVGKEALQWKKCQQQETSSHGLPTPQQIRHLQAQFSTGASYGGDVNQMLSLPTLSLSTASASAHLTSGINSLSAAVVAAMAANNATSVAAGATSLSQRERGKIHFTIMMENTCNAVEKLHKLEQIWPTMLLNIVRNTLLDYTQLDVYIRDLMANIMKSN